MYVRIARFEGGDPARIDEQVAEMKRQIDGMRAGGLPTDAPDGVRVLGETVTRVLELVDRQNRNLAGRRVLLDRGGPAARP